MRCKKILAPTDLSKLSLPAIRYALELGLEQNAEVMIYHVLSEDGDWFEKDTRLDPASAFTAGKRTVARFHRQEFCRYRRQSEYC